MPVLSLGTGTFGGGTEFFKAWGSTDAAAASRLVDICLDAGLNMFDSADVYSKGLAEEILGQAIKGRRDQVILSTKGSFRMGPGPNDLGSSRSYLTRAVEGSLRRLGTDYIDLYQLHGFDAQTPVEEVLQTLDGLSTDSGQLALLFKTHPRPADRLQQLEDSLGGKLAKVKAQPSLQERFAKSVK